MYFFEKMGGLKCKNFRGISNHENITLCVKPLGTFLGKCDVVI